MGATQTPPPPAVTGSRPESGILRKTAGDFSRDSTRSSTRPSQPASNKEPENYSRSPITRSGRWHASRWDRCTDRPVLHGQHWPRLGLADLDWEVMAEAGLIRTPDQRVRVFVSSALQELAAERRAVRDAIPGLRGVPLMCELGARPHPPRTVYRAYLAQSQVFVGIYWQS